MAKGVKLNGAVSASDFVAKYRKLVGEGKSTKEVAAVLRGKKIVDVTDKDTAWVAQRATSARNGIREALKAQGVTDVELIETKIAELVPSLTGQHSSSRKGAAKSLYADLAGEIAKTVQQTETETETETKTDENPVE